MKERGAGWCNAVRSPPACLKIGREVVCVLDFEEVGLLKSKSSTHTTSRPIFKHAQHTHATPTLPLGDTPNTRALPQASAFSAGRSRNLFQLLLKVFILALVIFKRLDPGAANDGAEDVLVVRRHLPASEPTQRLPLGGT